MTISTSDAKLSTSASPYVQQFSDHPVRWQPWDRVALEQARREDKPLLLSIGYPGCRRCLSMMIDCFADPEVVEVLNQRYVCAVVDRQERPDLDRLQQETFRLLYGRGAGWPLNMVLNPHDLVAFFGATHVTPEPDNGLPGLAELLTRLADLFATQRDQVIAQNVRLAEALRAGPPRQGRTGYSLHAGPLDDVVQQLVDLHDPRYGGFGKAPKFPQVPALERLLRHWRHTTAQAEPDRQAAKVVRFTLERMARSPLRDAAGGFSRYARAADWEQPDSEQTLVDNAQLLALYAQAWRAFKVPVLHTVAERTGDWLLAALRTDAGCFRTGRDRESGQGDETVLTGANALAIRGLAIAGRLLERDDLIEAADSALDVVHDRLWQAGMLHTGLHGETLYQPGVLDDYAGLLEALLELLQCRWRTRDYQWALQLADRLLDGFQASGKKGGFYFTGPMHEPLPARIKPVQDDALPAGNGVVAGNLLRLGQLTGSLVYPLAAERALKDAWPSIERNPAICNGLLVALEEYYFPSRVVVIRGPNEVIAAWHRSLGVEYAPRRMVLAIPNDATELPEALADCAPHEQSIAYLYQRGKCTDRYDTLDALRRGLANEE